MEWVETTGKTIEEAKEAALDELGVDEQDAEFEILEEPKIGLFGRVRSEARVRARVRPTTPRAKEDRRDRRRRSRAANGGSANGGAGSGSQDGEARDGSRRPAGRTATGDATAAPLVSEAGVAPLDPTAGSPTASAAGSRATADDGTAAPARSGRSRRRRSPRAGGEGSHSAADPTGALADPAGPHEAGEAGVTAPTQVPDRPRAPRPRDRQDETDDYTDGEEASLMDVALEEQGKVAEQFVTGLLSAFGLEASTEVTTSEDDERIDLRVDGDGLGLLIGPKGATLLAIQDLVRTVVQHRTNARNGRLYVDVSGYRERRATALAGFAAKVAADVLAQGQAIALEPMSAPDRKIVHDAVTDIPGVETRSEGEEERRHVVIVPTES